MMFKKENNVKNVILLYRLRELKRHIRNNDLHHARNWINVTIEDTMEMRAMFSRMKYSHDHKEPMMNTEHMTYCLDLVERISNLVRLYFVCGIESWEMVYGYLHHLQIEIAYEGGEYEEVQNYS